MEYVYANPTEAAKGLRAELKVAFPGIKFSVRTEYFSMGNAIRVSWSFGPTTKAVDAIVKKYEYGRFDGMTDSSSTEDTLVSMADGSVKVLGGAKFVTTSRNYHAKGEGYAAENVFFERVQRDLCTLQGIEYKGRETPFYANSSSVRDSVSDIANRIIWRADLTKGYNGLRRVESERASYVEERIVVIPEGEVAAPAPVSPAPVAQVVAVSIEMVTKAPAPDATLSADAEAIGKAIKVSAAAREIVAYMGHALLKMRVEAILATIRHRVYIKYPSLNRYDVAAAVLALLKAEVMA